MKYGYNGYTDSSMILNELGGPTLRSPADGAIIGEDYGHEFVKQPIYYVMGHFSKFIRPGSVRIQASVSKEHSKTNITTIAFMRPDNLTAVVLFNG